jgi:hypothetical protein
MRAKGGMAGFRCRRQALQAWSVALEHEDSQRLLAALQWRGLDSDANTNYILGLKRALGLEHAAG